MAEGIQVTDDQIISGIRSDDLDGAGRTAVRQLLAKYGRLIMSIGIRSCGLSFEDAEELRNDVVLEIVRKIDSYQESKGQFKTWIASIAKRRAIDRYRKDKELAAELLMPDEWWEAEGKEEPPAIPSPEETASPDILKKVQDTLAKLAQRDQYLLRLRAEGHSHEDIAKWLGIEKGAATVAYHRAKKRFEQFFTAMGVPLEQGNGGQGNGTGR